MVNKIREKFIQVRKDKNIILKNLYESLVNKIIVAEKSGQYQLPLTDDIILSIVKKEMKERKESQSYFKLGQDKYTEFDIQLVELNRYLPQQLSEEEVKNIIRKIVLNNKEEKNRGKFIGLSVKEIGDRFDKSKISNIVGEVLNENN